jgi:hypothetical protein
MDGTQTVQIIAEASGFVDGTQSIQVTDSDGVWHNRQRPFDVNNDGSVSPVDALLVINFLNIFGAGSVPGGSPPPYYDVNSDSFVTPIDALMVINVLNTQGAEGEGEGATPAAQVQSAASPIAPRQSLLLREPDDDSPSNGSSAGSSRDFEAAAPASQTSREENLGNRRGVAAMAAATIPAQTANASLDEFFAELAIEQDSLLTDPNFL